jgi:DNA-binding response OmpR family regulator
MSDRVLLIEDDPTVLALMQAAFAKGDYEVFSATNGKAGIEMFHSVSPDLVITDIVMPEREGMSVIIEVKKSLFDCGLIAISGGGERGRMAYLRWAKELGADLVIRKPFRMSMLLWMAHELLEERGRPRVGVAHREAPPPNLRLPFEDNSDNPARNR